MVRELSAQIRRGKFYRIPLISQLTAEFISGVFSAQIQVIRGSKFFLTPLISQLTPEFISGVFCANPRNLREKIFSSGCYRRSPLNLFRELSAQIRRGKFYRIPLISQLTAEFISGVFRPNLCNPPEQIFLNPADNVDRR